MKMSDNKQRNKPHKVKPKDLPLVCPTSDMPTWNSHPRVFLSIDKFAEATCPYCDTHFVLDDNG